MAEPATMIDTRFSEPGSAATPRSQTRGVLEAAELFWITTVRADGRPTGCCTGPKCSTSPSKATPCRSLAKVLAFGKGRFTHTSHRF